MVVVSPPSAGAPIVAVTLSGRPETERATVSAKPPERTTVATVESRPPCAMESAAWAVVSEMPAGVGAAETVRVSVTVWSVSPVAVPRIVTG